LEPIPVTDSAFLEKMIYKVSRNGSYVKRPSAHFAALGQGHVSILDVTMKILRRNRQK
jgi:hypothetical protein